MIVAWLRHTSHNGRSTALRCRCGHDVRAAALVSYESCSDCGDTFADCEERLSAVRAALKLAGVSAEGISSDRRPLPFDSDDDLCREIAVILLPDCPEKEASP